MRFFRQIISTQRSEDGHQRMSYEVVGKHVQARGQVLQGCVEGILKVHGEVHPLGLIEVGEEQICGLLEDHRGYGHLVIFLERQTS